MYIVSKDQNESYNSDHIINIFIDSGNCAIKVVAGSTTRGGVLGKYKTQDEMTKAFEILLDEMSRADTNVIYMPTDSKVADKLRVRETYHHITGKKTKGHGGS